MKKEKISRELRVLIQQSLYEKLEDNCNKKYKTISALIRELIVNYLNFEENNGKTN